MPDVPKFRTVKVIVEQAITQQAVVDWYVSEEEYLQWRTKENLPDDRWTMRDFLRADPEAASDMASDADEWEAFYTTEQVALVLDSDEDNHG